MKFSTRHAIAGVLVSLSFLSNALAGAGWTPATTILELNQQPASGVGSELIFVETALTSNVSGCPHGAGFYFAVTDDRKKRMFSMLVAAQLAGKQVKLYTTGNCHTPWDYAELDGVTVS